MIEVRHLTKRYGNHTAVEDLSFTVESGEIYGLLGPNGAGKSTTMNMMTGYISATDGTALIDGEDIFENPVAARKKIGYLPEQPPLYMDMTPAEYLRFVAELKGYKEDDFKTLIARAMETTGITEVQRRLIRNLSKGFKQRVALAGALLGEPAVIILDEPTVGLDPKQIIEIRALIKSLGKTHTVLLSSHILSEVSAVCDKVLIISKGKLAACGTPEELAHTAAGGTVLRVTVMGERAEVRAALAAVDGARKLDFAAAQESGAVLVNITCDEDADIRAAVSLALSKAGLAVLGMQMETKSLEDVFLALTNADGQAPDIAITEPQGDTSDASDEKTPETEENADESNL